MFVNVRDTCHEVLSSGFSLPPVKCFFVCPFTCLILLGVTRVSQTLFQFVDDMQKAKLVQYATLQKLVSLVLYPQGYINFAKTYVACDTSQGYANFAKTYVICIIISQATSILQKPMSLVLYPKLCQFCKYLCYLCYIPRLHQFCKNLCHLCYIPSYVNSAKSYDTCVIS